MRNRIIALLMLTPMVCGVWAQKAERNYIRKGNRSYKDSVFVKAEVDYRKALDANPTSTTAMFNLGNALLHQNKPNEALEQYATAAKMEKDKSKRAQMYHNMGVVFQSGKDYAKAVEAYKESLRNNPKDDETRYNLALAQKLLKDQQGDGQSQNQDQQKEQNEQDSKEQEQQQNQQQQESQPSQPEKQDDSMSKENAEQLLQSVMQDEKQVQDKVKKQQTIIQGGRLEKDW